MVIVGMTGSGKTFFAEKILAWRKHVIVYDLKGEIKWKGYAICKSFETLQECEYPKIIFKPPLEFIRDKEQVEEFFRWVYDRGNCTLYVDELMTTCFKGQISYWLLAIITRGRELGVSLISSTQRPKQVPVTVFTESENWVVFRLQAYGDAKRIEENFGIDAESIQRLPKQVFYFGSINEQLNKPFTLKEK